MKKEVVVFPAATWIKSVAASWQGAVRRDDRAASAVAALFALLVSAYLATWAGSVDGGLWLVATLGASAVLVFGVPHSPMAQPWPLVGGHAVSALAGILSYLWIPDVHLAAAGAVAGAMIGMFLLRCLHPPGGGTALGVVVGGPAVHDAGFGFIVTPLALNVLTLLAAALVLNNLIPGRRYPLRRVSKRPDAAVAGAGPTPADVAAGLREMAGVIDVAQSDLDEIVERAMRHSLSRRLENLRCGDVMDGGAISVKPDTPLTTVCALLGEDVTAGIAIADDDDRVVGIITAADFLRCASPAETRAAQAVAAQGMTAPVITVRADEAASVLPGLFARHRFHHVPVLNADGRYAGMVTRYGLLTRLAMGDGSQRQPR